jgi:outer membrane protein OmpA-like peptidoglycan-associated protein
MKTLFIPVILFIGISLSTAAQEKTRQEKQGDKYAFNYSFDKAIESYNDSKPLSPEGQRKLAESYHNLSLNTEAEAAYAKLINGQQGILPEDYFNYAMILKGNGKYNEAAVPMDKFSELKPADLRAKDYAANKNKLPALLKDDGKYKIETLSMNTDADDFGTCFYKNSVVFSSTRASAKMVKRKYNWNGKPFLNMFVSELDGIQLKYPKSFDKSMNGKMHEGPASFSNDNTFMAFTQNHSHDKSKDKIVELQISFSSFKDGDWSKPEPFVHNSNDYSVGQPCLSSDGKTMYFTSDMPGGFGGADLYKTTKDDKGTWSKPENLGDKINTEGDEMFPFVEEANGVIFFSSNGRSGLGGLDVFYGSVTSNGFSNVQNAGVPLNTQYDDFAAIVDNKLKKGYFSSNRVNGSGDDDIYAVELLKPLEIGKRITGFAKNSDGNAVPKTFITLQDDKGKVLDTLTTKDDAAFTFNVESNKKFKLIGKKTNYVDGDSITDTYRSELIVKADVIMLTRKENVAKKVEKETDLSKIIELNTIYFDLDKYNIRPDAEVELDKIVAIMNEYPKMTVELGSYTDCRESKAYNQLLSDRRAQSSTDYIKKRITKPLRITGKGFGKTQLVNNCSCDGEIVSTCAEDEHQKNRRTEFTVVKK